MENVVANILVYYKSFYINCYLRKWRFLHFSRSSNMSGRNDNTLYKATFVTLNYLYLAHNTSKWSTLYILYHYVTYGILYKIFTSQHKMKVGQGRNFIKILTKFQVFRQVMIIIITIWCNKSVENVMTHILVYYMNSYTNYLWRY